MAIWLGAIRTYEFVFDDQLGSDFESLSSMFELSNLILNKKSKLRTKKVKTKFYYSKICIFASLAKGSHFSFEINYSDWRILWEG